MTDHTKFIMEQEINVQNVQNTQDTTNAQKQQMPPKPDNNLLIAIVTTICCCLPLGIVAIVKASKVNGLYIAGQYEAATQAAAEAKKWSLIGIACGAIINLVYFVFYLFLGLGAALGC